MDNIIVEKTRGFAVDIIKIYQNLSENKHEYVLSKQLLRSGTSIGANVKEAVRGFSKADFSYKMSISLKEASETEYWLDLLHETEYLTDECFIDLNNKIQEIIRILVKIVKNSRTDS